MRSEILKPGSARLQVSGVTYPGSWAVAHNPTGDVCRFCTFTHPCFVTAALDTIQTASTCWAPMGDRLLSTQCLHCLQSPCRVV